MRLFTIIQKQCIIAVVMLLFCVSGLGLAKAKIELRKRYPCVGVELFEVNRDDRSTHRARRIAAMPQDLLEDLRDRIIKTMRERGSVLYVDKAEELNCGSKSLILGGEVFDYKKGNRVVRYAVGLGVGKQKIGVHATLRDAESGKVLKRKRIVDRKIGGIFGGSARKGQRDFVNRVDYFVRAAKF